MLIKPTIKASALAVLFCANMVQAATVKPEETIPKNPALEKAAPSALEPETPPIPLTGTFDLTSNYLFRGISASNNLPAVQGGLTYTYLTPGLYFTVWGSNASYPGTSQTLELDGIIGINNNIGENFNYDISFSRYFYPKAADSNYNELITKFSYYFLVATVAYSTDVYSSGKSGTYYNLGVSVDLPPKYALNVENINISAGVGHYNLPRSEGLYSYNDYSIQISKTMGIYNLAVLWANTGGARSYPLDGEHIVGTVTVTF